MSITAIWAWETLTVRGDGADYRIDGVKSANQLGDKLTSVVSMFDMKNGAALDLFVSMPGVKDSRLDVEINARAQVLKHFEFTKDEAHRTGFIHSKSGSVVDSRITTEFVTQIKHAVKSAGMKLRWLSSLTPLAIAIADDEENAIVAIADRQGCPIGLHYIKQGGDVVFMREGNKHDTPFGVEGEIEMTSHHAQRIFGASVKPTIIMAGDFAADCFADDMFKTSTSVEIENVCVPFGRTGDILDLAPKAKKMRSMNLVREGWVDSLPELPEFNFSFDRSKLKLPSVSMPTVNLDWKVQAAVWMCAIAMGGFAWWQNDLAEKEKARLNGEYRVAVAKLNQAEADKKVLESSVAMLRPWQSPLKVAAPVFIAAGNTEIKDIVIERVMTKEATDGKIDFELEGKATSTLSTSSNQVASLQKQLSKWLHVTKGWDAFWPPEMHNIEKGQIIRIEGRI